MLRELIDYGYTQRQITANTGLRGSRLKAILASGGREVSFAEGAAIISLHRRMRRRQIAKASRDRLQAELHPADA